jgi:predicted nucleic acid-binding protein
VYLLDTNVVSEMRKRKPHKRMVAWIQAAPEESLYVSAVTVGEIQAGIEITSKQDAVKAKEIELWLDGESRAMACFRRMRPSSVAGPNSCTDARTTILKMRSLLPLHWFAD